MHCSISLTAIVHNANGRMNQAVFHGLGARSELADRDVQIAVNGPVLRRPGVRRARPVRVQQPDAGGKAEHRQEPRVREALAKVLLRIRGARCYCVNSEYEIVLHKLQQRVDAVKARTKGLAVPRVFMPIWYDPITTIGKNAFITEIIEAAGGRSVTDDLPTEWPQISMEVVLERSPDALLLVRGGKTTLQVLEDRPGWSSMAAIKAHRAYYVDERINFASPVAIDALEDLAKQFHP